MNFFFAFDYRLLEKATRHNSWREHVFLIGIARDLIIKSRVANLAGLAERQPLKFS